MTDAQPIVQKRKLIEVALPLEAINRASAREKSIRHGHPSTLHLWWARRPLAAARAVLFSQLVDDPSSHPDRFPTDADVVIERKRLHDLIEKLVIWENSGDRDLFRQANQEILDSTGGSPPTIFDPFAGGGTIPLEAQRLGLDARASDLNPVAVLINKALIEIPARFAGKAPVNPGAAHLRDGTWPRATGLADDIRYYGQWMRDEAERRIGKSYPKAKLSDGTTATVIAWIWARTVRCPNPACGIDMPLVRTWWLGKKKGKEAFVVPVVVDRDVRFRIGRTSDEFPSQDGTISRTGAICIRCDANVDLRYIRTEATSDRLRSRLIATVAEGSRSRSYLSPTQEHERAAEVERPDAAPSGSLPDQALGFRVQAYGMKDFADLFTNRQILALSTFADLVIEVRERVRLDAIALGLPDGNPLEDGGASAAAYAEAVSVYLAFVVSRLSDYQSVITTWASNPQMEILRNVFSRQAIPMAWDYAEGNPFASSSGTLSIMLLAVSRVVDVLQTQQPGKATQGNASSLPMKDVLISTDPPYYDNIGYSDLSDFFYIWLRRPLRSVFPQLLSTLLVPKSDELIANPFRHGGEEGAKDFFEAGFIEMFQRARASALTDFPITVYYAFKQAESGAAGQSSTGWETLLEGMVQSGWAITATWPLRSERSGRMRDVGSNALASSIVLALRPRPVDAPRAARRSFVSALKLELPTALRELQQGAIAPVDLPQAAIGPGMAVFSRYAAVLADDGTPMRVRAALSLINEVLDEVLSEQEGDFDPDTRFALAWFRQHGFDSGEFGDADNLARARNASLEHLDRAGILSMRGTRGKVTLLAPSSLDPKWDPATDRSISAWEVVMHLARTLTDDGIVTASALLTRVPESIDRDLCKELAFLLFALSEDAKRTKVAIQFNALGTAWNDIAAGVGPSATQGTFDDMGE